MGKYTAVIKHEFKGYEHIFAIYPDGTISKYKVATLNKTIGGELVWYNLQPYKNKFKHLITNKFISNKF